MKPSMLAPLAQCGSSSRSQAKSDFSSGNSALVIQYTQTISSGPGELLRELILVAIMIQKPCPCAPACQVIMYL